MIYLSQISSLENILPKTALSLTPISDLTVLRGERASYQIAYTSDETEYYNVKIDSDINSCISLYRIGNVPVHRTVHKKIALEDDNYISTEPGLYPDVLYPMQRSDTVRGQFHHQGLWIEIDPRVPVGEHEIRATFSKGEEHAKVTMRLHVLPIELPKGRMLNYTAVHADCIAHYYKTDVFSEKHWSLLEKFLRIAAKYGTNMTSVPVFTPPVDTEIGGERLTVQLVDIQKDENGYTFDFSKFDRYISMCREVGIDSFFMPQFFTQWGAESAAKFIITENGVTRKAFGWSTPSTDEGYLHFLSQLLPALIAAIKRLGIEKNVYFAISDEPFDEDAIKRYTVLADFMKPYLEEFEVIDAFMDPEHFKASGATVPLIPTDRYDYFEGYVDMLCVYYCCAQDCKVSNRFINMPLYRNRSIGYQFYKHKVDAFFHWALNFYNSQLSIRPLDPFTETDADGGFPAGDTFSVYPWHDGPIPSMRLIVFHEALQDLCLFELLETRIGRDAVISLIEDVMGPVTFENCARSAAVLLELRKRAIDALQASTL